MLVQDNSKKEEKKTSISGGRRFFYCMTKAGADDKGAGAGADDKNKDDKGAGNNDDKGGDDDDKQVVPLYKFRNLKEKFDGLSAEIEGLKVSKSKEAEDKLKADGKLQELLDAKEKELLSTKDQLSQISGKARNIEIKSRIREELIKHNPKDINIVMSLISQKDLEIKEEDGEIVDIKGLTKMVEAIKKEKDYLFGESKKNDNKDDDENNRQGAGDINSVEAEYRQLLEKPTLTIQEQNRLRELTKKLKELRSKKQ